MKSDRFKNLLWKSVDLLPVSIRLATRCQLIQYGLASFEDCWKNLAHIGPNSGTALDIGANRGLYSYKLAKLYDKVIVFEPNRNVTGELLAARSEKIDIHHIGLSNRTEDQVMYIPKDRHAKSLDGWASLEPDSLPVGLGFGETIIPTKTLDSLALSNIRFIKMDVEGHEVNVVRGGLELLTREKPVVLAEVRMNNLKEFEDLMNQAGLKRQDNHPLTDEGMFLFAS